VKGSIQYAIDQIFSLYDSGKVKDAEALAREFDVWFEQDYGDYYIMCITESH
jgi:catalase (peroxidase I)